ncbi:SHOCT domain-containing protein [Clostridium arbusti]|jgi:putative membrane protein|uniref:SHOCT domain-containing protein n=1 Tax=Clostridium arbusti TaxID=1137848 RepID=UPI000289DBE2|nr:SHOCT domain-containing protein [Clostridium arbusti]
MFGCGYGNGFIGWGSPYLIIFMIIRFLIIIGIVVVGIKLLKGYFNGNNNAIKTLNSMYAKGEITEEEYKKRKEFIKNN